MLGYVVWSGERKRPREKQVRVAGVGFCLAEVRRGGALETRRAQQAAAVLARAGVRRAVFPEDFPYLPFFLHRGIRPVETMALRRRLVWPWVERRLDRLEIPPYRASAAVCAAVLDRQGEELVERMAGRCRYLLLDGPGEQLARRIRKEWGAAVCLAPGREALEKADALVLLTRRDDLSGQNPAFCALYPGAQNGQLPLRLPRELWPGEMPPQGEEQLTAALYFAGVLPLDTILIEIGC